jgi:hypothetical protein
MVSPKLKLLLCSGLTKIDFFFVKKSSKMLRENCGICMEPTRRKTPCCRHFYHNACLREWSNHCNPFTCPSCRCELFYENKKRTVCIRTERYIAILSTYENECNMWRQKSIFTRLFDEIPDKIDIIHLLNVDTQKFWLERIV